MLSVSQAASRIVTMSLPWNLTEVRYLLTNNTWHHQPLHSYGLAHSIVFCICDCPCENMYKHSVNALANKQANTWPRCEHECRWMHYEVVRTASPPPPPNTAAFFLKALAGLHFFKCAWHWVRTVPHDLSSSADQLCFPAEGQIV